MNLTGRAALVAVGALGAACAAVAVSIHPELVVPVVAAIAVAICAPQITRLARRSSWVIPLTVALVFVLIDFQGTISGPGFLRYATVAAVFLVALTLRPRSWDRPSGLWWTLLIFVAYGLIGTIYGRIAYGTENGALPIVVPMAIALLGPLRSEDGEPDDRTALKLVSILCSVFAVLTFLLRIGVLPEAAPYNHEKAFLLVLGAGCALAARSRALLALSLATTATAFASYPAATYALAAAGALGTVFIVRRNFGTVARKLLAILTTAGLLWAISRIDVLLELSGAYFEYFGKINNSSTRAALYELALKEIAVSPAFSRLFTGELTVVTTLSGEAGSVIPVHNDFLTVALAGGYVGMILFLGIFLLANGMVMKRIRSLSPEEGRLTLALLAAFNAAGVTAFANPVFMNPGTSTLVFTILLALMTICSRSPSLPLASVGRQRESRAITAGH